MQALRRSWLELVSELDSLLMVTCIPAGINFVSNGLYLRITNDSLTRKIGASAVA